MSSTRFCANLCLMGNDCPGTVITDTISRPTRPAWSYQSSRICMDHLADLHHVRRGFAQVVSRIDIPVFGIARSGERPAFQCSGNPDRRQGAQQLECRDVEVEDRTDLGAPGSGGCVVHTLDRSGSAMSRASIRGLANPIAPKRDPRF